MVVHGYDVPKKAELLPEVKEWLRENPKLSEGELVQKALLQGSLMGIFTPVAASTAALVAAAMGVSGFGGLGSANAGVLQQLAGMYQAAAPPATDPATAHAVLQSLLLGKLGL